MKTDIYTENYSFTNDVGNTGSFIGDTAGQSNGTFYFNINLVYILDRSKFGCIVEYYTTIKESSNYSTYFCVMNNKKLLMNY